MPTFSKLLFSNSTGGAPFRILGATTSGGTLIHTCVTGSGDNVGDEVYIYVTNTTASAENLTLRLGGTASGNESILSIPPQQGWFLITPGFMLNAGLEIRAHATASNAINVTGWVNRVVT